MRTVNNHKQLFIAKDENTVATAGVNFATAVEAGTSGFGAGQVAIVDAEGIVRTAASSTMTDYDYIWVVQSQGAGLPIIKSAPIPRLATTKAYGRAYAAATEQVDYIGYDAVGNTGSIAFTADEAIIVRASLKSNFYQFQDKEIHVIGDYTPDSTDTEATVAAGLCKSLIQNSEKYVNIPFTVSRVHSAAGSATGAAADTVVGVKGSKTVTITDTGSDASTIAIAAGDYIRLGTADTAPVYKVTASTVGTGGGTLTLDIALQESFSLLGTTAYFITAANAALGDFGIKLVGKAGKFEVGKFRYEKSKWVTTIAGAGATTVVTTAASEGNGTYSQIAEDEWFYQLGEGMHQSNIIQIPPVTMRSNVSATGTYNQYEIVFSDVSGGTDILHNPVHYNQVKVAFNKLTSNVGGTEFEATLEEFLGITITI